MAVEAASEQGWQAGYRYLRRLREGLVCERRKLDNPSALLAAGARQVNEGPLAPLQAIERFGPIATREAEVLVQTAGPPTCAELWRLATEHRLRPVRASPGPSGRRPEVAAYICPA